MTFKLLSYNIRFGGAGREHLIARVIRAAAPELVVFQEATNPEVIEQIAEETEFPLWAAKRGHSIAFLSRMAVAHYEWHYSLGARHPFMEIELTPQTRVFGLHLSARFSKWSEMRRVREIRQLLADIQKYQYGFHALVGDFNTLAPGEILNVKRMPTWIRALIWLSGRDIQRHTIQTMLDANYVDGFRHLHPVGDGTTFPTWDPHLRLDYVFIPKGFAPRLRQMHVLKDIPNVTGASDHFPLLAEIECE